MKTFKCVMSVFLRRLTCQPERSGVNHPTGAIEPVCLCLPATSIRQRSQGLPGRREASSPGGTLNIHLAAVNQTRRSSPLSPIEAGTN